MTRRQMAATLLAAMINSDGSKEEKVRAAVEYADLLLIELSKTKEVIPHDSSSETGAKKEVQEVARKGKPEKANRATTSRY